MRMRAGAAGRRSHRARAVAASTTLSVPPHARPGGAASSPASDLVTNNMLLGTVMHTLFNIQNLRLRNNFPADIQRVITNSKPIHQLV